MKGEQGVTQSGWHTVDLYLPLPRSNLLVVYTRNKILFEK